MIKFGGCYTQRFYQKLFCNTETVDLSFCKNIIVSTLEEEATISLLKPVTLAEVKQATFSMGSFKAPGPDGFQPIFFKNYWEIVSKDIHAVVQNAFSFGIIDPRLAKTLIVLIPKADHPKHLKEFRTISLCNVLYKIITKVLVNRIRPFL